MLKYLTTLCTIFLIESSLAQSTTILLSGVVSDKETNQPLPFASISIFEKPIGTVTNANGEFDFYIPEQYRNDTLIISHVGYNSYRHKIVNISTGILSIKLQPRIGLLDEVVIHEKNLTAKEIVAKAVSRLTLNYSTKPFCLQGFFREIEQENEKYVLLTEAAVDIYDEKFDGKPKGRLQESVDVREMRRSLRHAEWRGRDNIGFALADLLENNDVRYNRGMLNPSNKFSVDTVTVYQDRPVYGISMRNKIDSGMMYIDMETFGFLKISMERKSRDKSKNFYDDRIVKDNKRIKRVWFRYSVEFESYDNKLYPRRMHESELNEHYDVATGKLLISGVETLEFIAINILPDKENKQAKQLKYGMMIKEGEYHPEFWKTFNTLKLTPLDEKLIQDLTKEISLEEQFKKSDNRNKP